MVREGALGSGEVLSVVRGETGSSGMGEAEVCRGTPREGSVVLQRTRSEGIGKDGMMAEGRGVEVTDEERLLIRLQVRLLVRLQFVSFLVMLRVDTAMSEDKAK